MVALARWVSTDSAKRTIDLDSLYTCREIAERERDFGSKKSLESTLRYDTTVPLARLCLRVLRRIPCGPHPADADEAAMLDWAVKTPLDRLDDELARGLRGGSASQHRRRSRQELDL